MAFSEILSMAFQNIRANMLRAVLTLLIIAFGIMALVGILTAIDSIAFSLNDNLSGLGANSFSIERKWGEVKSNKRGKTAKQAEAVTYRQAMEFKERFDFPAKVAVGCYGDKKTNPNVTLNGADENFMAIKGVEIELGRGFSRTEVEDGAAIAVIGSDVVKTLFDGKNEKALGQIVSINNHKYRVVGIMASKGSTMNESSDRKVYAPLVNIKALFGAGDDKDYFLLVAVTDAVNMDAAQSEATGLFRQVRGLRPGEEDDFEVFTSNSIVAILKENTVTLRLAAVAIGLMTLLGAAIGLMNIMLVSVTERTREIGIYKALGATRRSILTQFLTEAIVICQIGGIVGILLGILIGNIVTPILGGSFLIPWGWILLGFTLCMIVGVISGFYPAMKAARLDPIESLRYE
jgi:putative ABC transport system permease protein